MVATRSRLSRLTVARPLGDGDVGHRVERHGGRPVAVGTRSAPSRARSSRAPSISCTRTGISRSSIDTLASAASKSPMVATRTVSAMDAVVTPSRAASSVAGRDLHLGPGQGALGRDVLQQRVAAQRLLEPGRPPSFRSSSSSDRIE